MKVSEPFKRVWTDENGRLQHAYRISYIGATGKRVRKQFPTKAEARQRQLELIRTGLPKGPISMQPLTISEAIDMWLVECETKRLERDPLEPATIKRYRGVAENHVREAIGGLKVSEFTSDDAEDFINLILQRMSRAQTKKVLDAARGAFRAPCKKMQMANPFSELKIGQSTRVKFIRSVPTSAEVAAMLDAADRLAMSNDRRVSNAWRRYRPLVYVIAATGCRLSEARGLAWPNILFDQNAIVISQRAEEDGILGPPKSIAGTRKIHVPARVMDILKDWQKICPATRPDILADKVDNWEPIRSLVFPTGTGRPERAENIARRGWLPLMKAAGMFDPTKTKKKCRFDRHSLRHHRASVLVDSGATIKEVQHELGHESIEVTLKIYASLFDNQTDRDKRNARAELIGGQIDALREPAQGNATSSTSSIELVRRASADRRVS